MPEYERLGTMLASTPKLTVAKMDGTLNEVPKLAYDGYPTLLLYTATNTVHEVGEEVEKTAEGLAGWLHAHVESTHKEERMKEEV